MGKLASSGNIIIMRPGTWKGINYTKAEIGKGFKRTVWEKACFIYDNFEKDNINKLVGEVRAPTIDKRGVIMGSPVFFDEAAKRAFEADAREVAISLMCGMKAGRKAHDIEYVYFGLVEYACIPNKGMSKT